MGNTYPKIKYITYRKKEMYRVDIKDPNFDRPLSELTREYPDLENRIIFKL